MKKEKLKKNLFYNISYEILVIFLPLVLSPYVSRVLGADALGIYSYTYTIANYFVMFSMLGIRNYGNRLVAQIRNDQNKLNVMFSSLFTVHAIISIIFCILYFGYTFIFGGEYIEYFIIQGLYVLSAILDISWFYFGIEKFKITVLRSVFVKILNLILIFVFVRTRNDLNKYCFIMTGCILASQIMLWFPLGNFVKIQKPGYQAMKSHLKPMFILFFPTIAVSLYKYMDKIMIGSLSNKAQLGFYQNAEQLVNIPNVIINAIGTVMLPKMSNLIAEGKKQQTEKYFTRSMRYFMCMAFALSFGLAAVADNFAPLFWGKEFSSCSQLIMGLAMTVPFVTFANIIRTQYLIPNSKDKEYLISVIVGAVINIILNSMLIRTWGAKGAVLGTISAEISVCLVQAFLSKRDIDFRLYIKQTMSFCVIGIVMFICSHSIGDMLPYNAFIVLAIQVLAGVIIYSIGSGIVLYKMKDDFFSIMIKR